MLYVDPIILDKYILDFSGFIWRTFILSIGILVIEKNELGRQIKLKVKLFNS